MNDEAEAEAFRRMNSSKVSSNVQSSGISRMDTFNHNDALYMDNEEVCCRLCFNTRVDFGAREEIE